MYESFNHDYHKIQSVYLRNQETRKFIDGAWTLEEFDFLKNNEWVWTEKGRYEYSYWVG